MRIQFPDLARPKQAAKNLVRLSPDLRLSAVHEALAHALGYRDWHEFSSSHPSGASTPLFETDDALRVILGVADALELPDPDVQYAISKASLLQDRSIDNQLSLRSAIWRKHVFGAPRRGKPGTILRNKAYGANEPAYLRQAGRPTHLLFDTGMGMRADFEVATPLTPLPDFVPSRLWLPYGCWTLQDNSEVIFARDYYPMWRIAEGAVERLDPWLWINDIANEVHFGQAGTAVWASGLARELALRHLEERRIFELPKLVDVMPYLFETDVQSIADGVEKLWKQRGGNQKPPAYAELSIRITA
ncbi:hypothetical protein Rpal_2501 [Rhodopseudomonas palustris TIE-1]|uniref:hypothetical protein n=1 Tax=Rhodopseudomonas palustris TaxID=1076 RepID=UPI00017796B7|nr:hypothetical protein [Rhodopseudomonas palustris]ACF01014.1 hypothetical protein Rpal_2501 [Rhodopseudomonas palustris TIE-1]